MKRLKYLFVYTIPATVFLTFNMSGIWTFTTLITFFGFVPLLELLVPPDRENMNKKLADDEKNQKIYDYILYAALPVQIGFLIYFFFVIEATPFGSLEYIGRITAMGFMCGVVGINVGHELGHRNSRWEQLVGELLLLTSLDTHFLPYHNAGHHRNVATPADSATARKNEILYVYWFRSHFGSYIEAWQLENQRLKARNLHWFSLQNLMVVYTLANVSLVALIYTVF